VKHGNDFGEDRLRVNYSKSSKLLLQHFFQTKIKKGTLLKVPFFITACATID